MPALVNAAAMLLNQIHRAGGYQVFDPGYKPGIDRAMRMLEEHVINAVNAGVRIGAGAESSPEQPEPCHA